MSSTGDQRLENEPDEDGVLPTLGGAPAGHGPPPRIAKPRFPPTMLELPPPAEEPGLPPLVALPFGPPPIAEPRFPDTLIDLDPPTEMRHALESAPATTRNPSDPSLKTEAEEAAPSEPAPRTVRSKSDVRIFSPEDESRWLDRYELITEIAAGGVATVFLARLAGAGGFQRLVAIKRLHPVFAAEPELVEMFREEARIAAQIHHAHAVPILEIGSSAHGDYLVMEYIEGVTLAQIVERAEQSGIAIATPVALRILLDALSGLHAAHELHDDSGEPLGMVHRDVTPQNILVGADGAARLTNFGVARSAAHPANAKIETVKGRVEYMAPEQIRQEPIDRRADLFAMGVILWEVLAGRPLFRGETRFDTIVRALNAPVPRLRDKAPTISEELDALSARALARPVEERFQSAVEMAAAIEQVAKGSIATAREVAKLVAQLFGPELDQRRADVRRWLGDSPVAAAPLVHAPEAPIASGVARPDEEDEAAADLPEAPESVTVARPRLESLASIPLEGDAPIEPPPSSPKSSTARRALTFGAGVAVMALGALAALMRSPGPTATEPPTQPATTVTAPAPATATAATSVAVAATASATATATTTATAAEVPTAAPLATVAPLAAPSASAHPVAPGIVKPAAPATTKASGEDLDNPYR